MREFWLFLAGVICGLNFGFALRQMTRKRLFQPTTNDETRG